MLRRKTMLEPFLNPAGMDSFYATIGTYYPYPFAPAADAAGRCLGIGTMLPRGF